MTYFSGYLPAMVGAALALSLSAEAGRAAETASSSSRMQLFASQLAVLDGRAAEQYSDSTRLKPPSVVVVPTYSGNYQGVWLAEARTVARRHGVPEDLFLRLIQQESGWNPEAVSVKGAKGLAQLMPATAEQLGVDIDDPAQNLDGGARYLSMMHARFGTWRLALAAYNAGPEAVARHGDVPPYAETQNYVVAILGS